MEPHPLPHPYRHPTGGRPAIRVRGTAELLMTTTTRGANRKDNPHYHSFRNYGNARPSPLLFSPSLPRRPPLLFLTHLIIYRGEVKATQKDEGYFLSFPPDNSCSALKEDPPFSLFRTRELSVVWFLLRRLRIYTVDFFQKLNPPAPFPPINCPPPPISDVYNVEFVKVMAGNTATFLFMVGGWLTEMTSEAEERLSNYGSRSRFKVP